MKIEKRGKYPGVKVHLDAEDVQTLINAYLGKKHAEDDATALALKIGKKINTLLAEYPTLLKERTEEEIREELEEEQKAAGDKLAAMDKGKDWKKVGK